MKKLVLIVMIVFVPVMLTACRTVKPEGVDSKTAAIDAEVAKAEFTNQGWLVTDIEGSSEQVLAATRAAIDKAGFKVTDVQTAAGATKISTEPQSATPDLQQSYNVTLEPKGAATRISIHFGMYGHISASQSLLGMILREMRK